MNDEGNFIGEPRSREGRHRGGGAASWTPSVPTRPARNPGRRRELTERPIDPPSTGSLPLSAPAAEPWPRTDATSDFRSAHGQLPVQQPPRPVVHPEMGQAIRRTKVTLTARPPARPAEEDEDVRVYFAQPLDGLGTFDLGNVPASVTPPKTWRKAAWFASLCSGGVVVALLCAGPFLVGMPGPAQLSVGNPGYRGGQPLMNGELETGPSSPQPGEVAAMPSDGLQSARPANDGYQSSGDAVSGTPGNAGSGPAAPSALPMPTGTAGASGPTSNPAPRKPPITRAPMQVRPPQFSWRPMNAQQMGENSQAFLNTVTDNPAAACNLTTGRLHDRGPRALARRYADVAYFEVKNVYIDPNERYTINTVEVTYGDGTKTTERRKLTFGDDNKIVNDGR
jgi:hypothetical protein